MDATLTRLTLATAELAAALHGAPGALAPRLSGAERDATALREPTYVFRIERSVLDLEAAQSFYVHLPTLRCVQVVADGEDAYALTHLDVADVIYAGLIEAAGIWPDTHPGPDPDAPPPEDAEEALTVTLVVLHAEDDGFTEHELSWLDLDDDGLWLIEDGKLEPTSDYALYQRIPPLLHVLDR